MHYYSTDYIQFVCYGDDFIVGMHKDIHDILNIHLFTQYLLTHWDMTLRNVRDLDRFLSVPDLVTGDLRFEGAVFLQRRFVAREAVTTRTDLPPVLPHRPLSRTIERFAWGACGGNRRTEDYLLSVIGMFYDTQGTNALAYEFCQFMYEDIINRYKVDFNKVMTDIGTYTGHDTNLTRLIRKCGITVEDIRNGVPSRDSLLSRHIMDKNYTDFTPEFEDMSVYN